MLRDIDLQSIQEVRNYLEEAKTAQKIMAKMTQSEIDHIVESMVKAAREEAERLAAMAVEETGFGNVPDKTVKNLFAANDVYNSIKDVKTVGIIRRDEENRVWEVAQPVGIVAGIVPSTNPTSTVIFKSLIAVKAGNAIIFSPHPAAAKCTTEAARIMQEAAERAGAPKGLILCITQPTLAATNELMKHKLTDVILATGGPGLVRAAYSSGKPAYGVGPGNVPVYIHESANIEKAVELIIESKTFDYGTICASEQALLVDESIKEKVVAEMTKQGAYFLNEEEKRKVESIILVNGGLNAKIVGKSPQVIGEMAGIEVPSEAKVIVAEETGVGKEYPFSIEKLSPTLAFYTVKDMQAASELAQKLLDAGGLGHTVGIHAEDEKVIEAYTIDKPAGRIIVNAGTTFGAIGATVNVKPSLTLGCGAIGNNVTSDNVTVNHLFNIKRVAFGVRQMPKKEESAQNEPALTK
ncbi:MULTISPECIES: acetaldehyde dehydrogenase (acetylating) [Aeribacillus]|uniref:acetaldehyde dehydrogenase (acetylating) n=1 Tax=Aeribacillus TaxID=1055323 RepID=UPI0009EDAF7C|nr:MULTISPECIES: acetaldehyde dehydrogenase (acetylating) [Aeribacillus]MDR9795023.1 acetaldehyde dehydrogenase (acetylating) [Aeribacillus pallidus]MED0649872.1 acetaldehyde dehydrogenase (acetylating) [Aeribacillus composti]MED4487845.1 acetaldehyde dehydrogenase (acetylating) [Aeribacillus pallidus]TVZ80599.1 acetaldehyde dehydrogenase [Aeribacillus composti]BBU39479.1 aldehyde dehydrogenase [Aeribacillus pallidus]